MWNFVYLAALLLGVWIQDSDVYRAFDRSRVTIIDTGKTLPGRPNLVNAGPEVGRILNLHYFPAIVFYNAGRYTEAEENLAYLIDRPDYINGNPRKQEFMSTASYLRGMIYFYHSEGLGRHLLARNDFEAATTWNPQNYLAYIELSRVYSSLGFKERAVAILRDLLQLEPEHSVATEAQSEIDKLTAK